MKQIIGRLVGTKMIPESEVLISYEKDYSLPKISKATELSSCYDLYAWKVEGKEWSELVDGSLGVTLETLETIIIDCGFKLVLPFGSEAQIRSRSGLAAKRGLFVLNSPGTIDPDYRGNVKVILTSVSKDLQVIRQQDRIAQMKILFCNEPKELKIITDNELESFKTERGSGGLGSTGK